MIHIRMEGMERIQRKLGADFKGGLGLLTMVVGELIRNKVAVYPGPAASPVQWVSERQKRFYFAMRRAGGYAFKYTRHFDPMSQRLGPGWMVRREGEIGAAVVSHASYAPHVQNAERQQPMHAATGWITDREAVDKVRQSGDVTRLLTDLARRLWG